MPLGRNLPTPYLLVALGISSFLPVYAVRADGVPTSCASKCADWRDQCKVKACTKVGGHTQLHQGACYNLQATSQQAYSAGVAQCLTKAQACFSKCK
jgi:hypothetical protein